VEQPEVDPGDQHGFTPAKADVHCGHGFRREAVCGSTLPIDLPVPRARSFAFIPDGLKVVKRTRADCATVLHRYGDRRANFNLGAWQEKTIDPYSGLAAAREVNDETP